MDVLVIGAGPAGLIAAIRAAELGARTVLVTRGEVGGMAANDGPIPVRTLAQAARLLREARQLALFGIDVSEPLLDYPQLLARTREVVVGIRDHSTRREQVERVGVTIHEKSGTAHFVDPHTVETESGLRLQADKIILSAGGTSRRLPIPGFEWTGTHSDAWALLRCLHRCLSWGRAPPVYRSPPSSRPSARRSSSSKPAPVSCRPRTKTSPPWLP